MSESDTIESSEAPAAETTAPAAEAKPPGEPPAADPIKTVEAWFEELGSPKWMFAGARMLHAWPIGRELTRADYEAALDAAANVVCR